MEAIMEFLGNFDPAELLPDLVGLTEKVELLLRIAVMAGPLLLLGLGLWYFLAPPREANYSFGYRFFWGMSSVECWHFTQKLAGIVWAVLGLVLTIVMAVQSNGFAGKETMDMVWTAAKCIFWELGLVAVSVLVIDFTVLVMYNSKGQRRWQKKK